MSFFSSNALNNSRQMFCQLYDGLTMRKKTKGYRKIIGNGRMTICGTSTGVLLPAVLHEFIKDVMTDGVLVRCLFMVLGYRAYVHDEQLEINQSMPTIAQMSLAIVILGRRQLLFSAESEKVLNGYIENLSRQANASTTPLVTFFVAKQAVQKRNSHRNRFEQTLQVFDISELSSVKEKKITNTIHESRQMILKRILLFSKILIVKESFHSC